MPTTSPAKPSSTTLRSRAMNWVGLASRTSLPLRTWCAFIPRTILPEQIRTKATRSRCARSMFAWILKTKPLNSSRVGSTVPWSVSRGRHQLAEGLEEGLQAEVVRRAAEEHGRELARLEPPPVEPVAGRLEQVG